MSTHLIHLNSLEQVFDVLGKDAGVAALTDRKPTAVGMWRTALGRFPSKTYVVMTKALADKGFEAPPELWGMTALKKESAA